MTNNIARPQVLLAAIALLAATSAASADMMYYNGVGLHQRVKIHASGLMADDRTVKAGQMLYEYQGEDYIAYCVDIDARAATTNVVELSIDHFSRGDEIAWLYLNEGPNVSTNTQGAAFQVAMWELVYELLGNPLDVTSDYFYMTVRDNKQTEKDVRDGAHDLLWNKLADMPSGWEAPDQMVLLYSCEKQDMIIPEPGSLVVLIAGGLGLLARRSRR